jgi:hypothetical protein
MVRPRRTVPPGLLVLAAMLCVAWPARTRCEEPVQAIALPAQAPEPVRWAAGELARVLRRHRLAEGTPAQAVCVRLDPPADAAGVPESFSLRIEGDGTVTVAASDAVGAMYGLLELAEQLEAVPSHVSWSDARARLTPMTTRPAVRVRAVNLFLHLTPDGRVAEWFHDEEFWRRLLERLARSRFNLIDFHGAFCPRRRSSPISFCHFSAVKDRMRLRPATWRCCGASSPGPPTAASASAS